MILHSKSLIKNKIVFARYLETTSKSAITRITPFENGKINSSNVSLCIVIKSRDPNTLSNSLVKEDCNVRCMYNIAISLDVRFVMILSLRNCDSVDLPFLLMVDTK
mgnify:FL=1